jgi:hypothetical protein
LVRHGGHRRRRPQALAWGFIGESDLPFCFYGKVMGVAGISKSRAARERKEIEEIDKPITRLGVREISVLLSV